MRPPCRRVPPPLRPPRFPLHPPAPAQPRHPGRQAGLPSPSQPPGPSARSPSPADTALRAVEEAFAHLLESTSTSAGFAPAAPGGVSVSEMCSGRSAPTAAMCMSTSACWWGVCLGARTPGSCACSWLPSPRGCPLPARRSPPLGLFAQAKPRIVYEIFTTKQRKKSLYLG
uniref:Uncharacterized protein n=1 Tax=Triticum urartu TaxID=4572 RepID=A0A8R7QTU0_TRIUA